METNETIFTKSEKEYKEIDKLLAKSRKLFDVLKVMEASGLYGTAQWAETFAKYAEAYKKANGYRPHWAR